VNDEQRRKDIPFGELAMQMGMLNAVELEEILQKQRDSRVDLCGALVQMSCLPEDRVQALFDQWKSEQAAELPVDETLPPSLRENPTAHTAMSLFTRMCQRVADLRVKVGQGSELDELPDRVLVSSIEVVGTRPVRFTLMVDQEFGERLARGLLGMELDALAADLALEAVAEFLNVMMGNVVASLAEKAYELRLQPPSYGVLPSDGFIFPVVTEIEGQAEIVVEVPLAP
jgi:CheY-specific phosphatase CheX